ncbi:DUF6197 family protein [Nocardia grenadensis]|uniref:DUF6197 family protein n=1 Tax=Nocardia grenadensis TaxID=931537 RepID=UPI0007A375B4|nr:hypothetical protein [Nocardia grenadensis]
MKTTIQNLKAARGLLAEHGIGDGDAYNSYTGKYCLIGAVAAAKFDLFGEALEEINGDDPRSPYGRNTNDWPEFAALDEQLPLRRSALMYKNLYSFNDTHMSRFGDGPEAVLDLVDRTIAKLENAGTTDEPR